MTDFKILGIPEESSLIEIKRAYRKRVKEIHPDLSTDNNAFTNHLLFIEINKAYQRLVRKKPTSIKRDAKVDKKFSISNEIVNHKDPAYVFYKTGMKYYMKVHPSSWNPLNLQLDPEREEDIAIFKKRVKILASLFPKAYYYFSIVTNEYPNSIWMKDSKDKMKIIEERTIMYKKIIESFSEFRKSRTPADRISHEWKIFLSKGP